MSSIQECIAELDRLIRASERAAIMEKVTASLGGAVTPAHKPTGQLADRVLGVIAKQPGTNCTKIAAALGMESRQVTMALVRLTAAKKVKRSGKRRGATYSAR